ncbi:MAG: tetratricopeptide repeat protein [Pseudomonadota bacterium]
MKRLIAIKWAFAVVLLIGVFTAYRPDERAIAEAPNSGEAPAAMVSLWNDAQAGFRKGDYDTAISRCEEIMKAGEGGSPAEKAYFLLADCYFHKYKPTLAGDFLSVIEAYQTAIQQYPGSAEVPRAYLQLGLVYQQMDYTYEASAYFHLVIKNYRNSPYIPYAHYYLGRLHLSKQDTEKARNEFETVISGFPESGVIEDTYLGLVEISIHEKEFEGAAENLDRLEGMRPGAYRKWPILLFQKGQIRLAANEFQEARSNFLRFLNISPGSEKDDLAIYSIGETYEREGRPKEALRLYNFLNKEYSQTEGAILARYRLIERIEKPDSPVRKEAFNAVPYLDVLEECPHHPVAEEAMARLVQRYYEAEKPIESLNWVGQFVKRYPGSGYTQEVLDSGGKALVFHAKGLYAKREYKSIITVYQDNRDFLEKLSNGIFYYYLAGAFKGLSLYDHAAYFYYRGHQIGITGDERFRLLVDWADTARKRSDYLSAIRLLQELISVCADERILKEAQEKLGETYTEAHQWKTGADFFSRLCKKQDYSNPGSLYYWAQCALGAGSYTETRRILNMLTPQIGDANELSAQIADLWGKLGDAEKGRNPDQAAQDYVSGLTLGPDPARKVKLHYKLGNCYEALGKDSSAETEYNTIKQIGDEFWKRVADGKLKAIKIATLVSRVSVLNN